MNIDKRTIKILAGLVAGGVVLAWLLNHFELVGSALGFVWGLLFPFVLGFILAFLLNIPMKDIEGLLFKNRGGRLARPVSFVLTLVAVLAVLAFVVLMVAPELWATLMTLGKSMPGYLARLEENLLPYLGGMPTIEAWIESLNIDWQDLMDRFGSLLQSGAGNLLSSAVSVATGIVGGFVSFFVGIVFACYLLLDKEHLSAQFQGLLLAYIPKDKYDKLLEVARLTSRTYSKFVAGQCMEALIVTLMYLVALNVGGFNYALLISLMVGLTSLIPMIGATIGCVIGALLIFVSMGLVRTVVFVVLFIVIQQIEGNLIYPHVVGSSVGLPPVWILVAVMVGGGLGGITGMLFFIPLFSVIYTLVHRNAKARLAEKGIPSPVSELPPKKQRKREKIKPKKKND